MREHWKENLSERLSYHVVVNIASLLGNEESNMKCNIFCWSHVWFFTIDLIAKTQKRNILGGGILFKNNDNLFSIRDWHKQTLVRTYKLVQFSVHIAGFVGEFGPENVSPHRIPLQVLIYNIHRQNIATVFES